MCCTKKGFFYIYTFSFSTSVHSCDINISILEANGRYVELHFGFSPTVVICM